MFRAVSDHTMNDHSLWLPNSPADFWAAVTAVVTIVAAFITWYIWWLPSSKRRALQKMLNNERVRWEDETLLTNNAASYEEKSLKEYFDAVQAGVIDLNAIKTRLKQANAAIGQKMQNLVSELMKTHTTLLSALSIFEAEDAEAFVQGWEEAQKNFRVIYHSGRIPSEAHTHCGIAVIVARELADQMRGVPSEAAVFDRIAQSAISSDNDIVQGMHFILSKTEAAVDKIGKAIHEERFEDAFSDKEKHRTQMHSYYEKIKSALQAMQGLAAFLSQS